MFESAENPILHAATVSRALKVLMFLSILVIFWIVS